MVPAQYAPLTPPESSGGVIAAVAEGSAAQRAGLLHGDVIVAVDGDPVTDVLDWQWRTDSTRVRLAVRRSAGESGDIVVERDLDEPWGVEFDSAVFDRIRTCRNDCGFCFMAQLPAGMRKPLYLRDDDYRLSFLQGNFITLTNLVDTDIKRIAEQHLSPLYVSLHSVDQDVRAALVCAREDRALERFDELLDAGIDLHVQIVLVPGVNDGSDLDTTLRWLAEREGVRSVGIVPLGYTAHQPRYRASYGDASAATGVIEQVSRWQEAYRSRYGVTWVHLADEFYLNAGHDVPVASHYDDFPQYENGIGLVRTFLDEIGAAEVDHASAQASTHRERVVVTGALFGRVLESVVSSRGLGCRVLTVPNRFFGGNVSVTGLLTGADLVDSIRADTTAHPGGDAMYSVPDVVFNHDGVTLDDMGLEEMRTRTDARVRVVSCDAAGLVDALSAPADSDRDMTEE